MFNIVYLLWWSFFVFLSLLRHVLTAFPFYYSTFRRKVKENLQGRGYPSRNNQFSRKRASKAPPPTANPQRLETSVPQPNRKATRMGGFSIICKSLFLFTKSFFSAVGALDNSFFVQMEKDRKLIPFGFEFCFAIGADIGFGKHKDIQHSQHEDNENCHQIPRQINDVAKQIHLARTEHKH